MKIFSVLACGAVLFLAGCSSELNIKDFENKDANTIYNAGKAEYEKGHYSDAIKIFDELERAYPYSKLVPISQVQKGNCCYKRKKYSEAASEYEIFIKTHPTHDMVPYALYMLGKLYYEQMPIVQRDQENTMKAKEYLLALNSNYPGNKYKTMAEGMIKVLSRQLAGREVYVGRYYQAKKNYSAAIGRFNNVVNNYSDSDFLPEAFHRLVECYSAMGLNEEATRVYKALSEKFPNSKWTNYARRVVGEQSKSKSHAAPVKKSSVKTEPAQSKSKDNFVKKTSVKIEQSQPSKNKNKKASVKTAPSQSKSKNLGR